MEKLEIISKGIWPESGPQKIQPLSHKQVAGAVGEVLKKTKVEIINAITTLMSDINSLCFMTDLWTSPTNKSLYVSHFISWMKT